MKVSVIVPAYNQKELLFKALDSVPRRDDVEIILVLNGADNELKEKAIDYCAGKEIKIIIKEQLGCWGAMNVGIDESCGEYIYQLDEDDTLNQQLFNEVVDNDLDADLVYVNLKVNDGTEWHINESNRRGITDHTSFIKRSFLSDDRFDIGGVNKIDGGYLLLQRLIDKNPKCRYTDKAVYNYNFPREHSLYWDATH